jgi:hypothetical protein
LASRISRSRAMLHTWQATTAQRSTPPGCQEQQHRFAGMQLRRRRHCRVTRACNA